MLKKKNLPLQFFRWVKNFLKQIKKKKCNEIKKKKIFTKKNSIIFDFFFLKKEIFCKKKNLIKLLQIFLKNISSKPGWSTFFLFHNFLCTNFPERCFFSFSTFFVYKDFHFLKKSFFLESWIKIFFTVYIVLVKKILQIKTLKILKKAIVQMFDSKFIHPDLEFQLFKFITQNFLNKKNNWKFFNYFFFFIQRFICVTSRILGEILSVSTLLKFDIFFLMEKKSQKRKNFFSFKIHNFSFDYRACFFVMKKLNQKYKSNSYFGNKIKTYIKFFFNFFFHKKKLPKKLLKKTSCFLEKKNKFFFIFFFLVIFSTKFITKYPQKCPNYKQKFFFLENFFIDPFSINLIKISNKELVLINILIISNNKKFFKKKKNHYFDFDGARKILYKKKKIKIFFLLNKKIEEKKKDKKKTKNKER
ncbi:hypothetical protein CMESO_240 (nucleomorph) [Chroomonas mesostigmatica CCMP1168]|uniref:Uncharacterized protein n=1 Tax=Chroomonas mesostigmatica CCMP1168 TaxID=1195612 RepID=J7G7Y8_9CRYP|nr:hypothetical protein CMESO_240 [Chroomonas mesostigmatica CCMP1168]